MLNTLCPYMRTLNYVFFNIHILFTTLAQIIRKYCTLFFPAFSIRYANSEKSSSHQLRCGQAVKHTFEFLWHNE